MHVKKKHHGVYPEGTTGAYQQTKSFKMGAFSEAAKQGFKIVPISVEYNTMIDRWASGPIGPQYFRQIGKWRTYKMFCWNDKHIGTNFC